MKMATLILLVLGMVAVGPGMDAHAASLDWTGGGDGSSYTDTGNWSGTPTGGTIDLLNLVDDYTINLGGANVSAGELRFDSAAGGALTILDGSLPTSGTAGLRAVTFDDVADVPVVIGGTGLLGRQFIREVLVDLGGSGTLQLAGGGNPINVSAINFTSTTSTLHLTSETPADFEAEHIGKISINGNHPVVGYNISVTSDGGSGANVVATDLAPYIPQTLNFTGAGTDPTDFSDAGNWDATPTGGVIAINNLVDNYVINDAGANLQDSAALAFEGGRLTVQDGSVTLTGGTAGLGRLGGPVGTVDLSGGAVAAQFVADVAVSLTGNAELTLNGGGNPVNQSTIDFTSMGATLLFLAEDVDAVTAEHLSKFTVNGNPAVLGTNLAIVSDGGAGAIVTSLVPEPSALAILVFTLLCCAKSRRRRERGM